MKPAATMYPTVCGVASTRRSDVARLSGVLPIVSAVSGSRKLAQSAHKMPAISRTSKVQRQLPAHIKP